MTTYQLNNETISRIVGEDMGMYCLNNMFYPMSLAAFFIANDATMYGVWEDGAKRPTHIIAFFPLTKSWMGITFRDNLWWHVVGGELANTLDHPFSTTSLLTDDYMHEINAITVVALQIKDAPDSYPQWEM